MATAAGGRRRRGCQTFPAPVDRLIHRLCHDGASHGPDRVGVAADVGGYQCEGVGMSIGEHQQGERDGSVGPTA